MIDKPEDMEKELMGEPGEPEAEEQPELKQIERSYLG